MLMDSVLINLCLLAKLFQFLPYQYIKLTNFNSWIKAVNNFINPKTLSGITVYFDNKGIPVAI